MRKGLLTYRFFGVLLAVMLAVGSLHAQQDPKFNQYMFNPLGINPAYAGSRQVLSTVLLARSQWVGFEGAPKTVTFAIHGPLVRRKMGLGFQITNDAIGPRNVVTAEVDYAYRFRMLRGFMSFGLSGGVYYYTFNWDKIDYRDQNDVIPITGVRQTITPDVDFGAYWNNNKMYFGLELAHLTQPRVNITDSARTATLNSGALVYKQFRQISFTAGRAFVVSRSVTLKPSIMYKQAGLYVGMVDLNFSVLLDNRLWLGVTGRPNYGGAFIIEYLLTKKFRMGYSFDYPLNQLRVQNHGFSHELFLGFDFGQSQSTTVSPRYF